MSTFVYKAVRSPTSLFVQFLFLPLLLSAGANPKKAVAVRTPTAPHIDGVLSESEWQLAKPITDFLQRDPDEGATPTERTEIRILYDKEALYFGCRMYDSEPAKIVARLARRDDEVESDFISIRIDSYHDHQTGFEFTVNAAGVKADILQFNDGGAEDASWDPVWDVRTSIDAEGWVAEVKIPFRVLRFSEQEAYEWGIQFIRKISRKQERLYWALVRKSESGFISKFGHLTGISDIPLPSNFELIPYAVSSNRFLQESTARPTGRALSSNAGFDLKFRPTGGLTVDATFNPDFGQVEADPAVLNLSTIETFYPEKRPFFIEGSQILRFTTFGGQFGPGLYYSRRIGKAIEVEAPNGGYVEREPRFATILGAVKLSGKTSGGMSIGLLEAVSANERAVTVDANGVKSDRIVEPLTNYSLVRLRQDVMENSNIGMAVTSVSRQSGLPAVTAGTDWDLKFLENEYRLDGFLAGSSTTRGEETIRTGSAGRITLQKEGGLHWRGSLSADFTSKGFGINDIGFFRRPNDHGSNIQATYREDMPSNWYRAWNISARYHYRTNFDGAELFNSVGTSASLTFSNYWEVSLASEHEWGKYDDRETRGHGLYEKPKRQSLSLNVESDSRQPVVGELSADLGGDGLGASFLEVGGDLELKPASNLTLRFQLAYNRRRNERAWVSYVTQQDLPGPSNILADRTTEELDLTTRGSFVFTRDLTLQIYFQLFAAKGKYERPLLMRPPNKFSELPFAFTQPDFNHLSFNSNVVLRWEYLPGSTIFLVWSQSRRGDRGNFASTFRDDFDHTFSLPAENVLLLKVSYWWSL